jgi:myosin heavy subunit
VVKHFAGDVVYSTDLFLEKNRSETAREVSDCLQSSSNPVVQQLGDIILNGYDDSNRTVGLNSPGQFSPSKRSPSKRSPNKSFRSPVKTSRSPIKQSQEYHTPQKTATFAPPTGGQSSPSFQRSSTAFLKSATRGSHQSKLSPKMAPIIKRKQVTVLSQFSRQLKELMIYIHSTRSHFVRCLKPNKTLVPDEFDRQMVQSQLRCGGLLGAVQVFRAGFPNRFQFSVFADRYAVFAFVVGRNPLSVDFHTLQARGEEFSKNIYWTGACNTLLRLCEMVSVTLDAAGVSIKGGVPFSSTIRVVSPKSILDASQAILNSRRGNNLSKGEEELCLGKTQLFLRATAFEQLELLRQRSLTLVTVIIQRWWRKTTASQFRQNQINLTLYYLLRLQLFTRSAIRLQRLIRMHILVSRLCRVKMLVTWLSARYRGWRARATVISLKNTKCRIIQRAWRGYIARKVYHGKKSATVLIQRWLRMIRDRIRWREKKDLLVRAIWAVIKLQASYRRRRDKAIYYRLIKSRVKKHTFSSTIYVTRY